LGYTVIDDENIKEYWIQEKDWIKTIDILIKGAANLEEYEYAIELKEIKELLK